MMQTLQPQIVHVFPFALCWVFLFAVPKPVAESVKNELTDAEKELYFHANIHYERNNIAPWPLCLLKCESRAADSKRALNGNSSSNNNNTIVIIDSDDSDCDDVKPSPTRNGNATICLHRFFSPLNKTNIFAPNSLNNQSKCRNPQHTMNPR